MKVHEIIKEKISSSGVTLTFLSKKTGINVKVISSCLNGKRQIKADEFISMCNALNIKSINDFKPTNKAS